MKTTKKTARDRYAAHHSPRASASTNTAIAIAKTDDGSDLSQVAGLSPAQRKFNTLTQKIQRQRELLQAWQHAVPDFRQRWAKEVQPLRASYLAENLALVRWLDQRRLQPGLSRLQADSLREAVCQLVDTMIDDEADESDAVQVELKAIYDRHSDIGFDAVQAEEAESLRDMARAVFGLSPDEPIDLDSPEALLEKLLAQTERDQEQQEHGHAGQADAHVHHKAAHKTARRAAKQTRKAEDAAEASRSLRDVFRKLASSLHPDREPDEAERLRKTGLMQRANQAYQNNDLLALLELQLEVEQIDQRALNTLSESRLKHFNLVLAGQLAELQQEAADVEDAFKMEFGLDPFERLAPGRLGGLIQQDKRALQWEVENLQDTRRRLTDDAYLKRWLKQQRALMAAGGGW